MKTKRHICPDCGKQVFDPPCGCAKRLSAPKIGFSVAATNNSVSPAAGFYDAGSKTVNLPPDYNDR